MQADHAIVICLSIEWMSPAIATALLNERWVPSASGHSIGCERRIPAGLTQPMKSL
jgi:hypothetical protein